MIVRGKTNTLADPSLEVLEQACARNLAAEVHYNRSDMLCIARMRLLWMRDGEVRTESAQSIGKVVMLRPDESVSVHFVLDDTQYAFHTKVIKPVMSVDLNRRMRVMGMALRAPSKVSEQQRRHEFRVSLAKHTVQVEAHEAVKDDLTCCPIVAKRFSGRLVNISVGGAKMVVATKDWPKAAPDQYIYVSFRLPGDDTPFHVLSEVRHTRRIHDDTAWQVGLQFQTIEGQDLRLEERRIRTFVTGQQREQLKKTR